MKLTNLIFQIETETSKLSVYQHEQRDAILDHIL